MKGSLAVAIIGGLGALFLATTAQGAGILSGGGGVPPGVLQWAGLAQKWAQIYSILNPEEILAIIWTESTGNPLASNPGDPSWGLMGVTALIAGAYGGFASSDTSWHTDPDKNVKAGAGFLADLKAKYSDNFPTDWVDAYNVGEPNLLKGFRTQDYIDKFNAHVAALQGQV